MKPDMRWFFFGISGRISRLPYLLAMLFILAVGMAILSFFFSMTAAGELYVTSHPVVWIYGIISQWVTVTLAIKRLHDFNKTGFFSLALFVPLVAVLALVLLCTIPGTPGPNAYGDHTDRPKT